MARHYICMVCGRQVATFQSWADVEPSELLEILAEELQSHQMATDDLDPARVLGGFRILDDEEGEEPDMPGVAIHDSELEAL
jgi:hypothetical protein